MIILSKRGDDEVKKLREFLRKTKDPHVKDRVRAIIKRIEGRKRSDVADFFDVNIKTIDDWTRKYNKAGVQGLQTKPQRGNNRILTVQQKQEIKKVITGKRPDQVGLSDRFWNVPLLREYIKQKYALFYRSPATYRKLFYSYGFTYHKPNKVNRKQSPHMRKRFEETLKKSSNGTVGKIAWYW